MEHSSTFDQLCAAIRRQAPPPEKEHLGTWMTSIYLQAIDGSEVLKKKRCGDSMRECTRTELAFILAAIVYNAASLANACQIDLDAAVVDYFNAQSQKHKIPVLLQTQPTAPPQAESA